MNTDNELNKLIAPLIARSGVSGKFTDDAAKHVLERLGVGTTNNRHSGNNQHSGSWAKKNQLTWWADDRAHAFFRTQPAALGVEVNSGISTRFHRLSKRADWPRFSWLMVNTANVNECLDQAFPNIDNFQNIASDQPAEAWLNLVNEQSAKAVFAVIGESEPLTDTQLLKLLNAIEAAKLAAVKHLELIIFHSFDDIEAVASQSVNKLQISIKNQCNSQSHNSILNKLFQTKEQILSASHLSIWQPDR